MSALIQDHPAGLLFFCFCFVFNFFYYFIMHMGVSPVCLSVYHMRAWCPWKPEEAG